MTTLDLLNQVQVIADQASQKAEEYSGVFGSAKGYILEHFGENGLMAAYIVLAALIVFVVSKIAKLTFSTLKYLVIPAVGVAFIASLFLPYSFVAVLPVSVTACSLFLLFKG